MKVNLNKQITQNFKLDEFLLSKFYDKDQQKKVLESVDHRVLENIHQLAEELQVLRNKLDQPIKINIGFRPLWWELKQGRSGSSQHVKGKAADIRANGLKPKYVAAKIEQLIREGKMSEGGLSDYNTFTHYDIRGYKARW